MTDSQSENKNHSNPRIIAIAGGKGGVGKSVLSASLAAGLARLQRDTVLIDADLGGANLHTVMGVPNPEMTISEILGSSADIDDILVQHPRIDNLRMLFGASGSFGIANLKYSQKQKFIRTVRKIEADYIVLDLGAGTSYNVLDLFLAADHGMIVVNPDPLSVLEGYNFVKQATYRSMLTRLKKHAQALEVVQAAAKKEVFKESALMDDLVSEVAALSQESADVMRKVLSHFRPMLLLNRAEEKEDEATGLAVQTAALELLSVNMEYLGFIHADETVPESVKAGLPFIVHDPSAAASRDLADIIIIRILHRGKVAAIMKKYAMRRKTDNGTPVDENTVYCSIQCLYWEDCPYKEGGLPCKMQHLVSIRGFQR